MIADIYKQSIIVLISIVLFVITFNNTIGHIFFSHVADTTVDSANGMANLNVFFWSLVGQFLSPLLIHKMGTSGCFGFFSFFNIFGLLYMCCCFKDSTWKVEDGKSVKLSELEKKNLYNSSKEDKD